MVRRFAGFLFILLAIVGLTTGGLLIWATSESGSRFISSKLRTQLRKDMGLDISFANIDLEIFPPRIQVRDLVADDAKKRVHCTVEEAEFAPSPLNLLGGILSIEEVYLGAPRCSMQLGKKEIDAIQEALQEKDEATDKGIELDFLPRFEVFALSSGSLNLNIDDEERFGKTNFKISGLGLDVTGSATGIEVRGLIESADAKWNRGEDSLDESLKDLHFRAGVQKGAIDVRHLNTILAGATISLRDAHIPFPLWPKGPDVADLSITLPLDLVNRLPLDYPPMSGTFGFFGQVSATKNSKGEIGTSARGQVSLEQGEVDEYVIGDLDGLVSLTPRGVAFAETDIRTADGRMRLSGNIAFDESLSTDLNMQLYGIELAHLLEQLTVRGAYVTQRVSGPIKLKGKLNPFSLTGMINLEVRDHKTLSDSFRAKNPPVVLHVPLTTVKGNVLLTDKFIETKPVTVVSGRTRMAVEMRINFDATWRLYASSKDFYLEDVKQVAGFKLGGHGPLTCLIEGELDDPRINGTVDFANFIFDDLAVERMANNPSYYDGVLSFDGVTAKRGPSRARADELVLDFNGKRGLHISTKIEAEHVAIEGLSRLFHVNTGSLGSPKGLLFGRVAIDYYQKPEHLNLEADLVHDKLEIFGERFGPDKLRVSWNQGNLTVTEFGLTKGRGTISITGAVRDDRTLNFIGVASNIRSETIDNPEFRKLGIQTGGQVFVVAEGSLEHPTGWADLRLGATLYKGVRYGPTTMGLKLDDMTISGQGQVAGDKGTIEYLKVDLDKDRFEVEGFISHLELVKLFDIDTRGHKASLHITGDLALSGRIHAKPRLSGFASISEVKVAVDDLAFTNLHPLRMTVKESKFHIKQTEFKGPNVEFDLSGMFGPDDLNLKIKGLADLISLSSLVEVIDKSDGNLNFEIRARGPWAEPSLTGAAEIGEGALRIVKFPYAIEQIDGRIVLTPKAIRFLNFTAQSAGGTLGMSGEMQLLKGSISGYKFRAQMQDLELTLLEDLTFTTSTTKDGLILRSSQNDGLPKVVGDLEIRNLRYTQDIRVLELSDLNVDKLSGARTRTTKTRLIDAGKDNFAFDIRLHGDRNLEARNNLFDVNLRIDDVKKPLRFKGTNQSFGFLGRVLGEKGQVYFAGKRFEIKYAAVDFQDPLRPDNPHFRVIADGQVRDWKITMTAQGTVEDYELKFASQPSLPHEDIVFLILTGMTRTENRQFGSSGISIGAPILGQLGPGAGAIPLEFRVYNAYSEKAGTETTRIALGRWITPDVWVSFSSSVAEERDVEAELDYKINDQFSIMSNYENDNEGPVGNVGVDLRFRLEF